MGWILPNNQFKTKFFFNFRLGVTPLSMGLKVIRSVEKQSGKKNLGQKNFWVKKNFGSKNFCIKKFLHKKNILGTKKLGQKIFRVKKNFWVKKFFGSKNFLGQKNLFF